MFEHKYTYNKNYCKFKDHCHYTGKGMGTAHSICNLKCIIPKFLWFFTMDQNKIIILQLKELAKQFETELNFLAEHTKNYKIFLTPVIKQIKRIDKSGKKSQKLYPTNYNLLILRDSWQAHQ